MPTPTKGPRLGGGPAHERLILANLATSLFEHDRITTTETKAKRLRPLAERLVTFAKRGDLASRRRVLTVVHDKGVVHRLFVEIAPDMAERNGGYTRITKIGARKGDNAPMAVIELVREPVAKKATVQEAQGATKRAAKDDAARREAAQAEAKEAAAATAAAEAESTDAESTDAESTDAESTDAESTDAESTDATEAALPEGAVAAAADGSSPDADHVVKGNLDSMKYHEPDGQWFEQTVAEVWFRTGADAEAAGFTKAGS